jgi:LEA14-like dessication related protein
VPPTRGATVRHKSAVLFLSSAFPVTSGLNEGAILMGARIFRLMLVLLMGGIAVSLGGCATKYSNAKPPEIKVVGLRLLPSNNILDQQFELELAVGNPNDFGLEIDGLRFVLYLNDQKFATGYSGEHVMVDRFSEARITTVGRTDVVKVVKQIMGLPNAQSLDYRIAGDAFLSNFPKRSVSFEKTGDIRLGGRR